MPHNFIGASDDAFFAIQPTRLRGIALKGQERGVASNGGGYTPHYPRRPATVDS